jgi:hypothetical protein
MVPAEAGSSAASAGGCGSGDKIVQRATVAVLNAIYEEDFLGFSYGFRPKRSQHDALDALVVGITRTKVNYIVDAATPDHVDLRSAATQCTPAWRSRSSFTASEFRGLLIRRYPIVSRMLGRWWSFGVPLRRAVKS